MNKFLLNAQLVERANQLLQAEGVDFRAVSDKCAFGPGDPEELIAGLKAACSNAPAGATLFQEDPELRDRGVRCAQNYYVVQTFIDRLLDEPLYEWFNDTRLRDPRISSELYRILTGEYLLHAFGNRVLELDFADYGFASAEQMFYVVGAQIANAINPTDSREVDVSCGAVLYQYSHDVHGDFRLMQYDTSEQQSRNPFDDYELLPFGQPKQIGRLAGYHSTETVFLATLLGYALRLNLALPVLDDFEAFFLSVIGGGVRYGNFGDAGLESSSCLFPFYGLGLGKLPVIPTDHDAVYTVEWSPEALNYYYDEETTKPRLSVPPEAIDGLVRGLFLKVAAGNGRTSINDMARCVRYIIDPSTDDLQGPSVRATGNPYYKESI